MKRLLVITAFNRPGYFAQTMETWRKVRGFYEWDVLVRLEPSPFAEQHIEIADSLDHPSLRIVVNEKILGVLEHPWVAFEEAFEEYDFVVRAEDDLPVSDDILEFFEWASVRYEDDSKVAAVIGYSPVPPGWHETSDVLKAQYFSPWVWGLWKDRWTEYVRDTWDHDYSTNNGSPGIQAGWDWNLDTRVLPGLQKVCVHPALSRVQNIGVWGVHGNPENHRTASSFEYHRDPSSYQEV